MSDIKIYNKEIADNLAVAMKNNVVTMASAIQKTKFDVNNIPQIQKVIASANPNQPDLYYRYAILASVGWNANDDVFDKGQTWSAKNSPTDKQLNFGHDDSYIIGHMTDDFILDEKGVLISADTKIEDVPSKYDIGVGFVLYRALANEERNQKVEEIIEGIDNGDWFVSMECRFRDFDYAVIDKAGNHNVIARAEESSYLTKYLRSYGGSGQYQDYKVGRLLKDFTFTGIGIVANPANKRSVIFNTDDMKDFSSTGSIIIKDTKMDEQIKELKAQLATANQKIDDQKKASDEALANEKKVLTTKVEELTNSVANVNKLVAEKDKALADAQNETKAANEKVAGLEGQLEAAKKEVDQYKKEKAKADRISQLVKAGVSETEALEIYTTWADASDAQFASVVKLSTAKKDDKKDDKKPEDDKSKGSDVKTGDLSQAKVEDKPTFTQVTEGAEAGKIEDLSNWLLSVAGANNKNTKTQE